MDMKKESIILNEFGVNSKFLTIPVNTENVSLLELVKLGQIIPMEYVDEIYSKKNPVKRRLVFSHEPFNGELYRDTKDDDDNIIITFETIFKHLTLEERTLVFRVDKNTRYDVVAKTILLASNYLKEKLSEELSLEEEIEINVTSKENTTTNILPQSTVSSIVFNENKILENGCSWIMLSALTDEYTEKVLNQKIKNNEFYNIAEWLEEMIKTDDESDEDEENDTEDSNIVSNYIVHEEDPETIENNDEVPYEGYEETDDEDEENDTEEDNENEEIEGNIEVATEEYEEEYDYQNSSNKKSYNKNNKKYYSNNKKRR